MLPDMVTTMANGFVVCVTQGISCPCPARSKVQQPCTVRNKATASYTAQVEFDHKVVTVLLPLLMICS